MQIIDKMVFKTNQFKKTVVYKKNNTEIMEKRK